MLIPKLIGIAAGRILPGCQDTGTAIIIGKRGQNVWTEENGLGLDGQAITFIRKYYTYIEIKS